MRLIDKIMKIKKMSFAQVRRLLAAVSPESPVYIFHHIPKCGGTSLVQVLDQWFVTVKDYRYGWTMNYPKKVDINHLRSAHCLCGHFELDGYYLHQRYPEILKSDRFKLFTFIRDPLQTKLALYRFEKKNNVDKARNIEEHLFNRLNYIANRFPATEENYKEVIDRYFFVGILDECQASLNLLARLIGKKAHKMPWVNRTESDGVSDIGKFSKELVERFRKENALDYLIYEYCLKKFTRSLAEQGTAENTYNQRQ
jgi:hypothetical protein